jgi:hypothetical protein
MMAYQDDELSSTGGQPNELYEFIGTYNTYRYTSSAKEIISFGLSYLPIAISRNRLKVSNQEQDYSLEIELPFDNPLMREYAYENSPPSLKLNLYRFHGSNTEDRVLLWNGSVTGFSVQGNLGKLKVPSAFGFVLEGSVPSPRYQGPCNHILYDERCGVDPALHQHATTVTSMNGNDIQVASLPFASNEASAGFVISASGEARLIISNIGTTVTMSYGFAGVKLGDNVIIRKGCDHSLSGHCTTRFSNAARFGGFPLVPGRNPFTSSLE